MLKNKAQINHATLTLIVTATIMLIITGVIFFSSLQALTTLKGVADDATASLGRNESITAVFTSGNKNGTGFALLNPRVQAGSLIVWNGSKKINQGIAPAKQNWTLNATDGILIFYNYSHSSSQGGASDPNAENTTFNDVATLGVINVTYSYNIGSTARNTTESAQNGLYQFAGWQPTWGMILAIAVILMMVMGLATFLFKKMG